MAPPSPSPPATSPASSSLSASAEPYHPAGRGNSPFSGGFSNYLPHEGSPSGPLEPSNRNVLPHHGSGHGVGAVPAATSVQAVQSRKRNYYTHFISLPLAIHSGLVEKLNYFQTSILDEDKRLQRFGIDKSIFARPETIHQTVLMLKLENEDRIDEASRMLQSVSTQVNGALENQPIFIQLRGLECMNGTPAKAQVVYAPVLEVGGEGRLARACKVIIDAFVKSGLALQSDVRRELKFHATIMNERFRQSLPCSDCSKKQNNWFDAMGIFNKYGKEEWGKYPITEVHLSQRNKFDKSGYYHCCSSISLPAEIQAE